MAKAQEDKITTLKGQINSSDKAVRLTAAHQLGEAMQSKALQREVLLEVNNHVHTTYSFSPYEPAGAAFAAWEAG